MTGADRTSGLDGTGARLVALAIALAGLAFLGWVHRADLFPPDPGAAPASPARAAFHACLDPQAARIAMNLEDGQITAEQATLFRSRAEAYCADQADKGNGGGLRLPAQ